MIEQLHAHAVRRQQHAPTNVQYQLIADRTASAHLAVARCLASAMR
jgi:hypothetical protein